MRYSMDYLILTTFCWMEDVSQENPPLSIIYTMKKYVERKTQEKKHNRGKSYDTGRTPCFLIDYLKNEESELKNTEFSL